MEFFSAIVVPSPTYHMDACGWYLYDMWVTQKLGFKKSSLSQVYAHGFQPVGDFVNTGFQKSSFSGVYAARFHPAGYWS